MTGFVRLSWKKEAFTGRIGMADFAGNFTEETGVQECEDLTANVL